MQAQIDVKTVVDIQFPKKIFTLPSWKLPKLPKCPRAAMPFLQSQLRTVGIKSAAGLVQWEALKQV